MKIVKLQKRDSLFDRAVQVFWQEWGEEDNFSFYYDCMLHSLNTRDHIPSFYVVMENSEIIGTFALIRNDINSRQDLFPWLACLYVKEEQRGRAIGSQMLDYALQEGAKLHLEKLYLTSELEDYYERYGWDHNGFAYGPTGKKIKVYEKICRKEVSK
ncbi:putative acetyltransferase [Bacillus sp. TS-2]|nr:putative acetyltransferase [Bacillus sp. TS-2]